ncbi:hypothetical protein EVAR_95764_1 [Eumeta japonica]|uniref:Uncharacterized protein n=1 Tax=Eumeta variegata TaxID=151549 RepID=A0A4C1UKK1_EUMVA|nr:hypothetical protein EVAR_95764_1 [Eumeta japonica]
MTELCIDRSDVTAKCQSVLRHPIDESNLRSVHDERESRKTIYDGGKNGLMEIEWGYEWGLGHQNSHSLHDMQLRKLLLYIRILWEYGLLSVKLALID